MPKTYCLTFEVARSRNVATSGTRPVNQKRIETVKYVEIANTSQMSGLRKFCHMFRSVLGTGNNQYARHGRPVWNSGKMPAHMTANSVMASADRLIEVRHFW